MVYHSDVPQRGLYVQWGGMGVFSLLKMLLPSPQNNNFKDVKA